MSSSVKISVIIPTLNEAENLRILIPLLFSNGNKDLIEVIVADANSDDQTKSVSQSLGAIYISCPAKSRAVQMNAGAKIAKGEILYFVHADTRPLESFVADIKTNISKGYLAGCYRYQFDSDNFLLKINSWFTRFNGIFSGGGDQTLFIKKAFFNDLNGFDEEYIIMEDFDLVRRIREKAEFRIIPNSIKVSARKYENNSWLRVQLVNLTVFIYFLSNKEPSKIKNLYCRLLNHR
ncbi:MAG: TIGR04283 family arsenosugar biosynthesis glycosyltransferase [Algoriphagus sp.]|nr:TIGR04283 family arsenosugar biosynthesis glycosyltransferase [Algoriphagus sp.]